MKATQFRYNRKLPVYGGVHPVGGFIAWPGKQRHTEDKELSDLLKRRRERRGFVAWPVK